MLTTTLNAACPHCGKSAAVRAHARLGSVCVACGYPRLGAKDALQVEPPDAQTALVVAYQQSRQDQAFRVARGVFGALGILSASLGLLFAINEPLSIGWRAFIIAVSCAPLALALFAHSRAKQRAQAVATAIEQARKASVKAWYQADPKSLTATSLSRSLQITEAAATQYLVESELDAYLDVPENVEARS